MSAESDAQKILDETLQEIADEASAEADTSDNVAHGVIRGDSGYRAKSEFKKTVTYIPSDGHGVWPIFKDAKDLCTCSSELASENIEIGLTFVYPCISKKVYAHILRPNRLLKMHSGLDLVVEISGNAWDKMNADERLALLHHELEHVDFREKRNGDLELRLIKHNVEDFYVILDKYGLAYIRPGLNEEDE